MYTGFPKHETTHTHTKHPHALSEVSEGINTLCSIVCVCVFGCERVYFICFVFVFMCVVLAVVPVPIDNDNNNTLAHNIYVCATTTTRRCVIRRERCIFQRALPTLYYNVIIIIYMSAYTHLCLAALCSPKTLFIELKRIKHRSIYNA